MKGYKNYIVVDRITMSNQTQDNVELRNMNVVKSEINDFLYNLYKEEILTMDEFTHRLNNVNNAEKDGNPIVKVRSLLFLSFSKMLVFKGIFEYICNYFDYRQLKIYLELEIVF